MWFGRCLLQMVFPHGSIAIISRSIAIARLHHGETVSLRLKNLSMMHWILPPAPRPCQIRSINLLNSESFSAFPAQVHFHLMSLISGVILSSCHPVTHLSSTFFFWRLPTRSKPGFVRGSAVRRGPCGLPESTLRDPIQSYEEIKEMQKTKPEMRSKR